MKSSISGYVDLQVNGYAGVDFNSDATTTEDIRTMVERLRNDQVAKILATVITDDEQAMRRRLATIVTARQSDPVIKEMIAGIHIEGPFLNPGSGTIGAHPADAVRPAELAVMQRLLEAAEGLVKIVTLAPEVDENLRVVRFLVNQGIVVSAGHCDPTLDQLVAAADAGLSLFTHVGNGCALKLDRHDNVIQRVLSLATRIRCCFIADGIHVPSFALKNYLQVAGIERSVVVTDAMAAAGLGAGRYRIGRAEVEVDENLRAELAGGDGRLAGSAATMPMMHRVLTSEIGLTDAEAERLLVDNPWQVLNATA